MACFIVPVVEAIITTSVNKVIKTNEKKVANSTSIKSEGSEKKVPFSKKLSWLNKLLWGGSALLAFEHLWHGEISPYFPFLTAVKEGETAGMLAEMKTAGVSMAVLVTLVWLIMLMVSSILEKKASMPLHSVAEDTNA